MAIAVLSNHLFAGERPWANVACDIAIPCATQNEVELVDANALIEQGCKLVVEGANMPCTPEAIHAFHDKGVEFGPAKAANAGKPCGLLTCGLQPDSTLKTEG